MQTLHPLIQKALEEEIGKPVKGRGFVSKMIEVFNKKSHYKDTASSNNTLKRWLGAIDPNTDEYKNARRITGDWTKPLPDDVRHTIAVVLNCRDWVEVEARCIGQANTRRNPADAGSGEAAGGNILHQQSELTHEYTVGTQFKGISSGAFRKNDMLNWLKIPSTIQVVKASAFDGCKALEVLVFDDTTEDAPADDMPFALEEAFEDNVEAIKKAYQQIYNVPCTREKRFALKNMLHQAERKPGLRAIIGSKMTDCSRLKTIFFPSSLCWLAPSVMADCISLEQVYCGLGAADRVRFLLRLAGAPMNVSVNEVQSYEAVEERMSQHSGLISALTPVSGEYSVAVEEGTERIEARRFQGERINQIALPSSLRLIEEEAFAQCEALHAIDLPSIGSLSIGSRAFWQSGIRELTLLAQQTIDGQASFSHCSELTTVRLHECRMTHIPQQTFKDCHNLISVSLPPKLQAISNMAFMGCSSLGNVKLPDTLQTIGPYAFAGCKALTEITLPDSVAEIPREAFEDCSNLVKVKLGSGLKTIEDGAFSRCHPEIDIYIPTSVERIAPRAFNTFAHLHFVRPNGQILPPEEAAITEVNLNLGRRIDPTLPIYINRDATIAVDRNSQRIILSGCERIEQLRFDGYNHDNNHDNNHGNNHGLVSVKHEGKWNIVDLTADSPKPLLPMWGERVRSMLSEELVLYSLDGENKIYNLSNQCHLPLAQVQNARPMTVPRQLCVRQQGSWNIYDPEADTYLLDDSFERVECSEPLVSTKIN